MLERQVLQLGRAILRYQLTTHKINFNGFSFPSVENRVHQWQCPGSFRLRDNLFHDCISDDLHAFVAWMSGYASVVDLSF